MNSPIIDSNSQVAIVNLLCEKLLAHYVFPETAVQICALLQQRLEEGHYADVNEGEYLALALTEHLQSVNQDEHLWVRWYSDPLPDHEGSLLQNQEQIAAFRQKVQLDNYGLPKAERLPGNVGYLDIRYFVNPAWGSGPTAVAAMNFLANSHALIVDLRQCQGGNPAMVALLSSYLFAEEPLHLNSLYWREEDFAQQYWTLPFVPGKRLVDEPVFVLTSKKTFSGGEEFAYNLQTRQRATLVGETTGGGAHPGSPFRLHPHFAAFIPVGRAINPVTGDNWEGRGVIPDVAVPAGKALTTAHRLALEDVIEKLDKPASGPLQQLCKEVQTALANMSD